jgi:integrase
MSRLAYINYEPFRQVIRDRTVTWEPDQTQRPISRLPQIFWSNGESWDEVNHWGLEKANQINIKLETVQSLMKHLYCYATYLEINDLDWRHFPIRASERSIALFRGYLISQVKSGNLESSTASERMRAVIQFYRHADAHDFLNRKTAMWKERSVVIRYFDSAGFKRTLERATTDLAIPNNARPGVTLEDGLLPLSTEHMEQLLGFTSSGQSKELHLMLTIGFFTGARISTITTLRIENLEQALPDPYMKGFYLIRVGPGTGVATKFSVKGDLLVPDFILAELKTYAYSARRLKRESKAKPKDRSVLFLTSRGTTYNQSSVARLMTDLRRQAVGVGLKFTQRFKFHQTRATYGTWLMKLALSVTTESNAIELVKSAMLHKNEAVTWRYIRFISVSKGKEAAANAFTEAFTGMHNRNWDDFVA